MNYNTNEIPPVLTVKQLAELLHVGKHTAYELARSDRLEVIKIGNKIRIPRHSVLKLLGAENESK